MNLNPWPYSYIRKLVDEASIEARQRGLRPTLASEAAKNYRTSGRFNIPFLGDYIPEGWKIIDETVFVSTVVGPVSWNSSSAISQSELYNRIVEKLDDGNVGYGVIEQGQFQVLVSLYRKEANEEES